VQRSLGDLLFKHDEFTHGKPSGLSGEPFVMEQQLTVDDLFVIVACDGVWDVMSHSDACVLVLGSLATTNNVQSASEALVEEAFRKGSTDNCTALVLAFRATF
jgi:serine/threonine protein phosphatase PrpC